MNSIKLLLLLLLLLLLFFFLPVSLLKSHEKIAKDKHLYFWLFGVYLPFENKYIIKLNADNSIHLKPRMETDGNKNYAHYVIGNRGYKSKVDEVIESTIEVQKPTETNCGLKFFKTKIFEARNDDELFEIVIFNDSDYLAIASETKNELNTRLTIICTIINEISEIENWRVK